MKKEIINDDDELMSIMYIDDNNRYHREDGPAYRKLSFDGELDIDMYYIHGALHNEFGPAVVYYNQGVKMYYINGCCLTEREFLVKSRKIKLSRIG